jgi:hypothetical protein
MMHLGTAGVPPAARRRREWGSRFALIAGGTPAVPDYSVATSGAG